jgi:hypothetical protein
MNCRIRDAALLIFVLVLATGLASAQPSLATSTKNSNGSVTHSTFTPTPNGPGAKAPSNPSVTSGFTYWDGLAEGDFYVRKPFATLPNPQIAAGPDDILTIAGLTIARYPNPVTLGGPGGPTNPYATQTAWPAGSSPTESAWLDNWIGPTLLPALCPSGTGDAKICIVDNATMRYDQMQGRYVVLMTVTDIPAHMSNWVMIISRFSQFNRCSNATGATAAVCPASSPFFTPPVIAPIVGGNQLGGQNPANWYAYTIPVNLAYQAGLGSTTGLGSGVVGKANTVKIGNLATAALSNTFDTTNFCSGGGPALGPGNVPTARPTGTAANCTNYFPTNTRIGFDNDNIIITAAVLDLMGATTPTGAVGSGEGTLQTAAGSSNGPYAGTRVVTFPKMVAYNGFGQGAINSAQPPTCSDANTCIAVNLSDDLNTGTIVGGTIAQTGVSAALAAGFGPLSTCKTTASPACAVAFGFGNPIPPIFWEPDNLRGRSLASFDSQVTPLGIPAAGVIAPIDYLVGTAINNTVEGGGFGVGFGVANPATYFVQPIVFSCNGATNSLASLSFCLVGNTQVTEVPQLGTTLYTNVATLDNFSDPNPVGQGFSATQMTTSPSNTPISSTALNKLFVGDSRPQQVIFREGLLYVARNGRVLDSSFFPLSTSTVQYDILKTCAGDPFGGPPPAANANPLCNVPALTNDYVVGGTAFPGPLTITAPGLTYETSWFFLQGTVPDPNGNVAGFGFYAPMFDVPADVVNSGPASPSSSAFPFLEKLFVGMTTGGTANLAGTFARNYPSLWDFRPGDDAFDTVQPYTDPYTGDVLTTVACSTANTSTFTVSGNVTNGSKVVPVNSAQGLTVGMSLIKATTTSTVPPGPVTVPAGTVIASISGNTVTLNNNLSVGSGTATPPTGGNTCNSLGVQPGAGGTSACVATASLQFSNAPAPLSLTTASVTATGFTTTTAVSSSFIGGVVNPAGTVGSVTIKTTAAAAAGATTLTVDGVTGVVVGENVTGTGIAAGTVVTNAQTVNGVSTITLSVGTAAAVPSGTTLTIDSGSFFSPGTTVLNVSTSGGVTTVTTSAAPLITGTVAIPVILGPAASATGPTCPMIPFSSRGGAATDPNDGSLWLYGEFAKNRFTTIPGPGTWGTSVANYALSFPGTDVYGNDNSFFTDVQPGSSQFTWIQIAKNTGLTQTVFVPAPVGASTCPNTGVTPILPPPTSGTTPTPGASQLMCPAFQPDVTIDRSEMARWVVLGQMDEQQITTFLCASGGEVGTPPAGVVVPTGCLIDPAHNSTFADDIGNKNERYIEVMARRGYTKGCGTTVDALANFCPTAAVTRAQMAVFVVRAKMNNVFPTALSGSNIITPYGDNFALFQPGQYFTDCTNTAANTCGASATNAFNYVQLLRELRITNGSGTTATYEPDRNITRKEVATFIVRAFFL